MNGPRVGETLPDLVVTLTRADVARYAAASGDHNPVHRDDAAARAAGLPGVVAHGMSRWGWPPAWCRSGPGTPVAAARTA